MTRNTMIRLSVAAILAIAVFSVVYVCVARGGGGILTVAFLDVGQGDAIFIESPTGVQVLVDGGANESVLRGLGEVMYFYDRSIDLLIATHPDKDHIGGLPSVLDSYDVHHIIESDVESDTAPHAALKEAITAEGALPHPARRGEAFDLGDGTIMSILFPDRVLSQVETNMASIVLKVTYGKTSFLLTGDAPRAIEEYLVALGADILDADVLKVGHHGSRTSSASVFVTAASPTYAVISAGKNNRYGHPHEETLATLAQSDAQMLGTYERGTIIFESDGEGVRVR